jgi:predicted nucleotidyltransferase
MNKGKIEKFCRDNNIDLMILFGSQAKKRTRADSDFDLAVKPSRECTLDKLRLIYKLGELFGTDFLDLVILTCDMDAVLLREIFMEGNFLYESVPGLFEKEKLRAWKIYLDTEKIRSYQKEYLKKIIRKAKDVARGYK